MLVISSREFREKQAEYMDLADQGEQIIVQRGKNKAYALTPISNDDMYFSKQMVEKIENAIQESQNGKVRRISGKEELLNFLNDL
jgi:antitoxin YefM